MLRLRFKFGSYQAMISISLDMNLSNMHLTIWSSGHYFSLITLVFVFLSFSPLLITYLDIGHLQDEKSINVIIVSIDSVAWHYALVANTAVSIPLAVDLLIDFAQYFMSIPTFRYEDHIPKFLLVISMVIPNLLYLTESFQSNFVELVLCISIIRLILIFNYILSHLWITGGSTFKSKWLVILHTTICLAFMFLVWDSISHQEVTILFWISSGFYSIGGIITVTYFLHWFSSIRNIEFKNYSISQINSLSLFLLLILLGFSFFILIIICRGNYDTTFFCICTYILTGFTLALSVLQSRLNKIEVIMKEVIYNIRIIYKQIFIKYFILIESIRNEN